MCRELEFPTDCVTHNDDGCSESMQKKYSRKKQKSSELSFAAPGLYPPPGTSPNCCLLVERVEGQDARFGVGADASRVDANHCIFLSAEGANTGLVDRDRNRDNCVTNVNATSNRASTSREQVAALSAAGRVAVVRQNCVNQAGVGDCRY